MSNEIYKKSWFGIGACNNIGWGIVYKKYSACSTPQQDEFLDRVTTDGGIVESLNCIAL